MNKFKNTIKSICLMGLAGVAVTSCDLDLLPLNEVVLENYWTEKADVESVVNACYGSFEQDGVIERMFIWGEGRSDNVVMGPSTNTDLSHIMRGNLLPSNGFNTWKAFYSIINRCNTVLHYAPEVQAKDPNFTTSDLAQSEAEVIALRSLAYFYLIRAFKDVPYVTTPTIDDNQQLFVAASKHEDILDSLINDLERVRENVPRKYPESEKSKNYGRVTRNMMYSLLADMYLWRASNAEVPAAQQQADYKKCVEYCDKVIEFKVNQYETEEEWKRVIGSRLYNSYGYPLLSETGESGASSTMSNAAAYNSIFGEGNSFESIFELQFVTDQGNKNTLVNDFFGNVDTRGTLAANDAMMAEKPTNEYDYDNINLFTFFDYRGLENFQFSTSGAYEIEKYRSTQTSVQVGNASTWAAQYSGRGTAYSNWIIYRLTDVMLMKAEAEVEIAGYLDQAASTQEEDTTKTDAGVAKRRYAVYGNTFSTAQEYYDDVWNIVCAIYYRSCPSAETNQRASLNRNNFTYVGNYRDLVEVERRRELMFEGKRYFDLVRRTRRDGNTNHLTSACTPKYSENAAAITLKLKEMDYIYMPYSKKEVETNTLLKQNPSYAEDETSEKS